MPDFFHVVHDLVKSYSLAIEQRLSHAQKEIKQAEEGLAKRQGPAQAAHDVSEARAEVERWAQAHSTYRHHLETLSLILHPFGIVDSAPQASEQVYSQWQTEGEAIAALVAHHPLSARRHALHKVYKQLPGRLGGLLVARGQQDLGQLILSPIWRQWAQACLLPLAYWDYWESHATHTRCARRKARMRQALEAVQVALQTPTTTQQLAPRVLEEWQVWATQQAKAFQRTSSAVARRNGYLSGLHHSQQGLPKHRYKVWTVLPNFDCRAADDRHQQRNFSGRHFRTLLKQFYPALMPYLGLGNENALVC